MIKKLQEDIFRIREVMFLFEDNFSKPEEIVKNEIIEIISRLKRAIPKQAKTVLNPSKALDKFQDFLLIKIPDVIEKSKTGINGQLFAYECYSKLSQIIDEELSSLSGFNKMLIKKFLPNKKDEFIKKASDPNLYNIYFLYFSNLSDFPTMVDQLYPDDVSKKMDKYSDQIYDWVDKNEDKIILSFVNKVANKIYN